jgi:hypothetical protein
MSGNALATFVVALLPSRSPLFPAALMAALAALATLTHLRVPAKHLPLTSASPNLGEAPNGADNVQ